MVLDSAQLKTQIRTALARHSRQELRDPSLVCAAVLIPLLCKEGQWHVLVTQRTQQVEHHKGQISFPGGACEPGDQSLQATALRETHEEIGVPPKDVELLGALDDFQTITGFVVTPFVGVIPYPFDYRLNEQEVEAVIDIPLSYLHDRANLRVESRSFMGRTFDVLFWDYGSHTVWGATAQMLKSFLDMVL